MIRFLFKQPKPRQFDFKPRYYNERREYLEARTEAIRRQMDESNNAAGGEAMRTRISRSWNDKSFRKSRSRSNRTVLILALLLFLVAYYILYT